MPDEPQLCPRTTTSLHLSTVNYYSPLYVLKTAFKPELVFTKKEGKISGASV